MPEGHLQVLVWDSGLDLARFRRELEEAWRGFDGVKNFQSLEGQFTLGRQHDGKGSGLRPEPRVDKDRPLAQRD